MYIHTRGINDLHVTVVKNYGKESLKHKATVLWNGLPNTLKKVSLKMYSKS